MFLSQPRVRLAVLAVSTALLGAAATASAPAVAPASAPVSASAPASADRQEKGKPYIETSLFFGTAHPDGSPPVTDRQVRSFVDEFVTPRFPDGLTVQPGTGQYRDRHGTIERERSYELILFYPTGQAGPSGRKIEEIRSAYEKKFGQESVARVDDRTSVDF